MKHFPKPIRLAIIATHPIQYQISWYQNLANQSNIHLKVYYALLPNSQQQGIGFGESFQWDVPLLEGYHWEVLPNVVPNPKLGKFFGISTPAIQRILAKENYDVVILTGWHAFPLLQALKACIYLDIPKIIRGDSTFFKTRPNWVRALHRILISRYDAFLTVGKSNQTFYNNYGVETEKIFFCPHFVDNNRIETQWKQIVNEKEQIRHFWNIPEKNLCFLFMGKLIPVKRLFDLLSAFEIAVRRNPKIHLLIVGAGELLSKAQSFVKEKALPVTFAGFLNQTQITTAYAVSDCIVLPSNYETWGLVVNEAMVCGLPAIVSDRVGCGPDLVEEGVTGSIFPFGNVNLLAERMLELASNQERLIQMGREAKQRIQCYSVEKAVEGTFQAIDHVLSKRDKVNA